MKKTPVIIDTDPGVDDVIAILLALASPELEILAIIVTYGNTDIDASYLNIFKLYQAISRHLEKYPDDKSRFPNFSPNRKPILARGCDHPLEGELHSARYFHGRDGLCGISERHPDLNIPSETAQQHPLLEISQKHGVDVALDLLKSHPSRSITYIALGPLTNVARMMQKDRSLVHDRIGYVVSMGGALDVPGNTTAIAEFNYFADPYAVKELLSSNNLRLPLDRFVMLPLDITTFHELPFPVYKQTVDPSFETASTAPSDGLQKPPITHFTSAFLERTREVMMTAGSDAMSLHDVAAVWYAIDNPPLLDDAKPFSNLASGWEGLRRIFDIERSGELTRGMLVVDRRVGQTAYSPGANRAEVQKQLERLGLPHKPWESTAVPAQVEVEQAPPRPSSSQRGVWCVTGTPGPKKLLEMVLQRIWGVEPNI